jgi:hypothetical protein
MRILLYEGETSTDILGAYECEFEPLPGMTVAIPGGATYYINKTAKNTTSGVAILRSGCRSCVNDQPIRRTRQASFL